MRRLFVLAGIVLCVTASAPAPGTCGPWVPQTSGTKWRMCTDVNNHQYCELKTGSKITRFECP